MIITTQLQMDFAKNSPGHVWAKQGDANSRRVTVALSENGSPWPIPETAVPVIRYQCLPAGSGGVYDTLDDGSPAWSISGSEISVILVPQILAEAGTALMDIALMEGPRLLATCNIHIHIEASPQEGTALRQSDYFNLAKVTAAYDSLQKTIDRTSDTIADTAAQTLAAVPDAVAAWLEAHPEVTTSVADGSISVPKTDFIHYVTIQRPAVTIPRFTNQIPVSTDAAGNPLGVVKDTYLGLYTDTTGTLAGFDTTGYIPLTGAGDVLRFENLTFSDNSYCRLAFYQPDKTFIGAVSGDALATDAAFVGCCTLDGDGFYTAIDLSGKESDYNTSLDTAVGFLRVTAHSMADNAVLTVNEAITYITIPGMTELADLRLDERIAVPQARENAAAIAALAQRVAALEEG